MDLQDQLDRAMDALDAAFITAQNGDHLAFLRCTRQVNEALVEAAMVAVQKAYDGGATKKAMADALDVPASTFRGLQKTSEKRGRLLEPATWETRTGR